MLNKTIKIVHRIRIYVLVITVIAFFYFLGANPFNIGKYIGARFSGAVGVSTSVPENPFNKLATQLKDKEVSLDMKERELSAREMALKEDRSGNTALLIMGGGIIVLFLLITINYILDFKRRRRA